MALNKGNWEAKVSAGGNGSQITWQIECSNLDKEQKEEEEAPERLFELTDNTAALFCSNGADLVNLQFELKASRGQKRSRDDQEDEKPSKKTKWGEKTNLFQKLKSAGRHNEETSSPLHYAAEHGNALNIVIFWVISIGPAALGGICSCYLRRSRLVNDRYLSPSPSIHFEICPLNILNFSN